MYPKKASSGPDIFLPTKNTMSKEDANAPNVINLDSMSLEELNQIKQQEEVRLQQLLGRYGQLRAAAARLNASTLAISELSPASEGKEVMVPLTESVYVPFSIERAYEIK